MEQEHYEKITEDEYMEFDRVPQDERLSRHPDLCAFLYIEKHFDPIQGGDILGGAQHDEVFVNGDIESVTDDQAIYLSRCGITIDFEYDCFHSLV